MGSAKKEVSLYVHVVKETENGKKKKMGVAVHPSFFVVSFLDTFHHVNPHMYISCVVFL